ncbi:MAG: DMT family transporter [Alphaproteobacteria bacterium]|nr:MAG: DMT family transporter [Alphaproteobacteria bacterium]
MDTKEHNHSHDNHLWPGVPLALGSAALFGASTPLAKLLIGSIDPWMLAGLLYLGAGIGLAVYSRIKRIIGVKTGEAPLRKADAPWLLLVILFGGVAGPVLLMLGLAQVEASAAALLLNLEGLATMLIAWVVFRENVDRRILLGAFAILAGAVLISWQGFGGGTGVGMLLIAAACLSWGVDNNLTRKLSSADPVQIVTIKGLVAGGVNVGLATLHDTSLPPSSALVAAAVVGFFGYGVSIVCYVHALRHLGTARCGAYFSTAPFIGAALALLLFNEPLTWRLAAAGALMLWGVWLHVTEGHAHDHDHEEMTHEHAHTHDAHHQHEHGPDDPKGEPHVHVHTHKPLRHRHPHFPDLHHRHRH